MTARWRPSGRTPRPSTSGRRSAIAWRIQRYDLANQAAERAHAINTDHAGALDGLSRARLRQGDHAGALAAAQRLLERFPYDPIAAPSCSAFCTLGACRSTRRWPSPSAPSTPRPTATTPTNRAPWPCSPPAATTRPACTPSKPWRCRRPPRSAPASRASSCTPSAARATWPSAATRSSQGTRELGAGYYARVLETARGRRRPLSRAKARDTG